jgi:S1-C subfamily serine protease/thiol-disulfide isomerase/thioredoxin
MKRVASLACLFVFGALVAGLPADPAWGQPGSRGPREWTDVSGKYHVVATLVEFRDGKVKLKKEDGTEIEVPLASLSEADGKVVQSLAAPRNPFTSGDVMREVDKAIVFLATRDQLGRKRGLGSGFVIDTSGALVTNYHVIANASSASARFRDGTEVEVAGYRVLDKKRDLAILQLKEAPRGVHAIKPQAAKGLKQGDNVFAVGHPGGFEFTVSNGIIGAIRKTAEMPEDVRAFLNSDPNSVWLQVSAPSAPGSSGGPLLDDRGDLVGVVTWVAPQQGITFAIHAQHLLDLTGKLAEKPYRLPVPDSLQGPGVTDTAVLAQLEKFRRDYQEYLAKVVSVRDTEKRLEIARSETPTPAHAAELRKLVEQGPAAPRSLEALATIIRLVHNDRALLARIGDSEGMLLAQPQPSQQSARWAFARLLEHHANNEAIGGLVLELCGLPDRDVHDFARKVIDTAKDDRVRGISCLGLALALMNDPRTRGHSEGEMIRVLERAVNDFGGQQIGDTSLREMAGPMLREAKLLSVGRTAANITGKDSSGQPFQLTDYRGKVVLLDFWVDWCPYCRAMYPQERMLSKKHGDRPFVIVGVNCESLARLQQVEKSGNVTWRSWADGPGGPIAEQWNVSSYPTLFLLDHRGAIRLKGNVRGPVLDAAVGRLLEESDLGLSHDLVPPSSVWSYFDEGTEPKGDWRKLEFDDSEWNSGRGVLGYGNGDEATPVDFGPDPRSKHITTYFRHKFEVKAPPAAAKLVLGLSSSGGAALYLNGQEVLRDSLRPGAAPKDPALKPNPDHRLDCRYFDLDAKLLRQGANILAVEVHQSDPNRDDLRFDLSLSSAGKRAR